jgi:hypothetical protein
VKSDLLKSIFLNKIILLFAVYFLQLPINIETDLFNLILLIGVMLFHILQLLKNEHFLDKQILDFQETFMYYEVFGYIGVIILLNYFIIYYENPILLASKMAIYLLIMSKYMILERVQNN